MHFAIEKSFRFPANDRQSFDGWHYRRDLGYWVANTLSNAGLESSDPKPDPKPEPMSKKADLETGEDMKGH